MAGATSRGLSRRLVCGGALLAGLDPARAQSFPSRLLKLIVPFPAGAGTDATARIVGQGLSQIVGQAVVVENVSGANGLVGTGAMARAAPDGYTLGIAAPGPIAIAPFLFPAIAYDAEAAFTPVIKINEGRIALAVHPKVPANRIEDLLALIRRRPGELNAANPTAGSVMHLVAETMKLEGDLDFTLVPYKGGAQATNDVLGGQVEMIFNAVSSLAPFAADGRLRILMVVGETRSELLPQVPCSREVGLPTLQGTQWHGIVVPKATPSGVVEALHAGLSRAIRTPEVAAKLTNLGTEVAAGSSADFAAFLQRERRRWSEVIRRANITAQ